ncbi:MAG: hypothetical protein LQ352_003433 [Teloschistes flavicans]|nr:MAG: hypothetical protein LQ352_003433 [Teloschistes flavicans]
MPGSGPKTAKKAKPNEAPDPATDNPTNVDVRKSSTAPRTWYAGGTWRRGSKATPVTQVAKESILAATDKASEIVTTARNPTSRNSTPTRSLSSNLTSQKRSSSGTSSLLSPTKAPRVAPNGSDNLEDAVPKPTSLACIAAEDGSPVVERARPKARIHSENEPEYSSQPAATESTQDAYSNRASEETPRWRGWFPLNRGAIKSDLLKTPDAVTSATSSPVATEAAQSTNSEVAVWTSCREAPRTWLGLWGNAKGAQDTPADVAASTATTNCEAPMNPGKDKKNGACESEATTTTKSSGWAFWTREVSNDKAREDPSNVGELALAGSPSQSHPESAVLNETDRVPRTESHPVSSSQKTATAQIPKENGNIKDPSEPVSRLTQYKAPKTNSDPGQQPKNLLLPPISLTYGPAEQPSLVQSLSSWWQQKALSGSNSARFISNPPRVKRALAIGVHGYFPAPLIRSVLGQPTGTSIRFADGAANAIQTWTKLHGYSCEIEKVALEGEGKILERVDLLWKLLLNWIDNIRRADFIIVACHSQGVPVAMMLIAKLIDFGCVRNARIGVCAMAGINLGPFIDYKSRWIGGSAGELFDFAQPDSQVSKDYDTALTTALRSGVKVAFIGRFALKLRNLGISDHGLIRELSTPLAGSLYSGEGHSKIYEDDAVYFLAVQNALQTISVGPTAFTKPREAMSATQNPYILPYSFRGLLEEDDVKNQLQNETKELLGQFDEWKPSTKVLKDVKFRLEGVRSKL